MFIMSLLPICQCRHGGCTCFTIQGQPSRKTIGNSCTIILLEKSQQTLGQPTSPFSNCFYSRPILSTGSKEFVCQKNILQPHSIRYEPSVVVRYSFGRQIL